MKTTPAPRRVTAGHIDRPAVRRRRRKAKSGVTKPPAALYMPEANRGGSDAAGVLVQGVAKLVERVKQEMEAQWRPVAEEALSRAEAAETKYRRFMDLSTRVTEGDQRLISSLQRRCLELEDLLAARAKVSA